MKKIEDPPDASDTLAVAVCHSFQKTDLLGNIKTHKDWGSFVKDNPDKVKH
jgi:Holliday junction resolvasome RuvABC endonuclease subunit